VLAYTDNFLFIRGFYILLFPNVISYSFIFIHFFKGKPTPRRTYRKENKAKEITGILFTLSFVFFWFWFLVANSVLFFRPPLFCCHLFIYHCRKKNWIQMRNPDRLRMIMSLADPNSEGVLLK
jgi:hypothetical protein